MKKSYKLKNLDCANCAAKIEAAINKLDGVNSATISFITQKFVIDANEDKFEQILEESARICRKVEPGCTILM
ncbi:MAG: cation transporter [Oscillospiraceae bacterium]|nr:cation transporter [Oscillospiraceae bacterium]